MMNTIMPKHYRQARHAFTPDDADLDANLFAPLATTELKLDSMK
jgi:hypothetical protein